LRGFAPIATHVINPVTKHIAGWMPGLALLTHRGRKTGRSYQTPVNVFHRGNQFVFVLTYGRSQWVNNVLAAGECQMRFKRTDVHLVNPEIIVDPTMTLVPAPVRFIGRLARVTELLRMSLSTDGAGGVGATPYWGSWP
jgi:deazaflavin-dependent oxidoreductase (nitroreductase family)